MEWKYDLLSGIDLHVKGKVLEHDASRQTQTAKELLCRLQNLPGQILADEVGMGKTFVALSAAASVALQDPEKRPVVIMIPPGLIHKWPKDLTIFKENCLKSEDKENLRYGVAQTPVEFLKLLDDPIERRSRIIFLSQGALHRSMGDQYVKLALIQRALYRRRNIDLLKKSLNRFGAELLRMQAVERRGGEFILTLLETEPQRWKDRLVKTGALEPAGDDPVPAAIMEILYALDTAHFDSLFQALNDKMPQRESANISENLQQLRAVINDEFKYIWKQCIGKLHIRLPLLILDEAHHLKNAATRFAGLFQSPEDAEEVTRGHLAGVFERMLFLTATPFQLGHNELVNVLRRFSAVDWSHPAAPAGGREAYEHRLDLLGEKLDQTQRAALILDRKWQDLNTADIVIGNQEVTTEEWWQGLKTHPEQMSQRSQQVLEKYIIACRYMLAAQEQLKPLVIRHHRSRVLPDQQTRRRNIISGNAIGREQEITSESGLSLEGESLFPFLLAARVTAITPSSRPVFAEGLASSFDAFLRTRRRQAGEIMDTDDVMDAGTADPRQDFYLQEIESYLAGRRIVHPKIQATVDKVIELWARGEKVLVFCHFIATGHALWTTISEHMNQEICRRAARALDCDEANALEELARIGDRFDSGRLREYLDAYVSALLADYPALDAYKDDLLATVRRYLRTPSFLIRFYPLSQQKFNEDELESSFAAKDGSGQDFRSLLKRFFHFLAMECSSEQERRSYIDHLIRIQTGGIRGKQAEESFSESELQGAESSTRLPNVRLANGGVKQEVRERLMVSFNTPFFPDVLIASAVMAEGVDLHQNCRYIIHHDLCWNPSTLEQRNGRVDRIGCRAEKTNLPIHIYYPYIGETQDEKMYRVVMDREKWFKVVMGEQFKITACDTDELAERIPFPDVAADEMSFKLNIV